MWDFWAPRCFPACPSGWALKLQPVRPSLRARLGEARLYAASRGGGPTARGELVCLFEWWSRDGAVTSPALPRLAPPKPEAKTSSASKPWQLAACWLASRPPPCCPARAALRGQPGGGCAASPGLTFGTRAVGERAVCYRPAPIPCLEPPVAHDTIGKGLPQICKHLGPFLIFPPR